MTKTKTQKKASQNRRKITPSQRRAQSARDRSINNARSRGMYTPSPSQYVKYAGPKAGLSECAQLYASAIEDPFNAVGACIPTQFAIPTQKVTARTRGTFTTGTNGYGGVVVSPRSAMYSDTNTTTAGNPYAAVIYTGSTYAGTTVPLYSDVGALAASTNSPYTTVDVDNNAINSKIVSCGLRVRNVTPQLNRGGTIVGLEEPAHLTLGGQAYNLLFNYVTAGSGDVNGGWTTIRYHPVDADETEFQMSGGVYMAIAKNNTAPIGIGGRYLCFLANASTAQTYEWELTVNFESIGSKTSAQTPVDSDVSGMSVVNNLFRPLEMRKPVFGDTFNKVKPALRKAISLAGELTGAFINKKIGDIMKV